MRIGIVGSGQLARMMALAGLPLSIKFSFINDGSKQAELAGVEGLGVIQHYAKGDDVSALYNALGKPDVITVEKEQLDPQFLRELAQFCPVYPPADIVEMCGNRLLEKQLLDKLNIPCARYTFNAPIETSVESLGLPVVVKSLTEGYDGKAQWVIRNDQDIASFNALSDIGDYITEEWIDYEREVSLVGARSATGEIAFYPLAQNTHQKGILVHSVAPAPHVDRELITVAEEYSTRIMEDSNYVGVLSIEFFLVDGQLVVNELAPRVHNSGHWTQQGCFCSQFENHVRAVAGLALGSTQAHAVGAMVNLLGTPTPPLEQITNNTTLHWYNKQPKPMRKMGHVNFIAQDYQQLQLEMAAFTAQVDTIC